MTTSSTLFELLTADRRRQVLLLLNETDSIELPEGLLTRGRAQPRETAGEGPVSPESPVAEDHEDGATLGLEIDLYHDHLPKLENEGLVEWDRESRVVSRGPAFEAVAPALQVLATNQDAFPEDLF
jgi:hypothetical protein